MTVDEAIELHGAAAVYAAADHEPGCIERITSLGLPQPRTLGDVYRIQRAAYAQLSVAERAKEERELRIRGAYLASACKTGLGPRPPRSSYVR